MAGVIGGKSYVLICKGLNKIPYALIIVRSDSSTSLAIFNGKWMLGASGTTITVTDSGIEIRSNNISTPYEKYIAIMDNPFDTGGGVTKHTVTYNDIGGTKTEEYNVGDSVTIIADMGGRTSHRYIVTITDSDGNAFTDFTYTKTSMEVYTISFIMPNKDLTIEIKDNSGSQN